jgi:transposase
MNTKNTNPIDYVAIDVSKDTLQLQDERCSFAVSNDTQGHRILLKHLKRCPNPIVVFEASGGYERSLLQCLRKAQIPAVLVNPARVRDYARSEGIRAKTDAIDGKMILSFAKDKSLQAMSFPSQSVTRLAALLDRRAHLTEQQAREKNRLQNSDPLIHRSIKRMSKVLDKEIERIEKDIVKLIDSDPVMQQRCQLIQSVKGVGKVTAWTILAYLAEIEMLSRNRLVALAGVAPFNRDSGKFSGKRMIQGGRAKVRKCLYMAAHTAATHNPVIAAYVQRLLDRGKPYKCAIVAAMRKLLIHLQSIIKKAQLSPCH